MQTVIKFYKDSIQNILHQLSFSEPARTRAIGSSSSLPVSVLTPDGGDGEGYESKNIAEAIRVNLISVDISVGRRGPHTWSEASLAAQGGLHYSCLIVISNYYKIFSLSITLSCKAYLYITSLFIYKNLIYI